METKETSVNLEFKSKIDLENIKKDLLEEFGTIENIKKDNKIEAILISNEKEKTYFILTSSTLSANSSPNKKVSDLKNKLISLAKKILLDVGKDQDDYETIAIFSEFQKKFSLKEKALSKDFVNKFENLLKDEGYDSFDYAGINGFVRKEGKIIGPISLTYKNSNDYEKGILTIECPEQLKKRLEKL